MNAPHVPRTSLVPDIAFVARERLDALAPAKREQPPLSPDVAIEIRSPNDRLANVEWKMRAYLELGGTLALDVIAEAEEYPRLHSRRDENIRARRSLCVRSRALAGVRYRGDLRRDLRD